MMKRTHAPQFGRSRERPTAEQKRRMDALSKMPCVCCEIAAVKQIGKTYVHHIVDRGYREHSGGHDATLPLCLFHHQGEISVLVPVALRSMRAMREKFGPSLALEKRAFKERYGDERELLARVNAKLVVQCPECGGDHAAAQCDNLG